MIKNLITNGFKSGHQLPSKVLKLGQVYRQLNTSLCLLGIVHLFVVFFGIEIHHLIRSNDSIII